MEIAEKDAIIGAYRHDDRITWYAFSPLKSIPSLKYVFWPWDCFGAAYHSIPKYVWNHLYLFFIISVAFHCYCMSILSGLGRLDVHVYAFHTVFYFCLSCCCDWCPCHSREEGEALSLKQSGMEQHVKFALFSISRYMHGIIASIL